MRKTRNSTERHPLRPVSFIFPPIRPTAGHFPEGSGLRYWPIRVVSRLPSVCVGRHTCQSSALPSMLKTSQQYCFHTTSRATLYTCCCVCVCVFVCGQVRLQSISNLVLGSAALLVSFVSLCKNGSCSE